MIISELQWHRDANLLSYFFQTESLPNVTMFFSPFNSHTGKKAEVLRDRMVCFTK